MRTGTPTRRALAVLAIAGCALLIAGAAFAGAAPAHARPESVRFEAALPSSNGYSIYLRGYGPRKVELDIGSEESGESQRPYITMTYMATGRVSRHGIEADFGRFGQVSLHFSGTPERSLEASPFCKRPKPALSDHGEMSGTVEFESLAGIVEATVSGVEGETTFGGRGPCRPTPGVTFGPESDERRQPRPVEPEGPLQTLLARAHTMARTIDLYAVKLDQQVIDVAATSTRRFGPVLVSTSVHAPEARSRPGEAVALSILGGGPRPGGARLSASGPFSGSATYRKRPGTAPTWRGSLAVKIPGEGTLPLAGSDFHAIICGYGSTPLERACEATVRPPYAV